MGVLDRFSLKGKTAVISGASKGIGLQVARDFASAGANIGLWFHTAKNAEELVSSIQKEFGVKAKAYQVNVANPDEVKKAIDAASADLGGLDIVVANAGIPWTKGPALNNPVEEFTKIVDIDLNGPYYMAHAAGQIFKRQGHGSLIFTASMSGHIVNIPQEQAAYNCAKAGILHLARSLAVEWAGFARVNTVSPGYTATEISDFVDKKIQKQWDEKTPMGRQGKPEELTGAYLYLASDASTYTTGTDVLVDGGYWLP